MRFKTIALLTAIFHLFSFLPVQAQEVTVQDGSVNQWDTFNVDAGQDLKISVVDVAGLPVADGRAIIEVLQDYASQIGGNLDIYGIIAILNAYGFDIGPGANIHVVGGLILSTLGISQEEFFSGMAALNQDPSRAAGFISNQGNIHISPESFIALIAGAVKNTGTIAADGGTAILAAGSQGTLSVGGDGLIRVEITEPVEAEVFDFQRHKIADQISNTGVLQADGGLVKLTAKGSEQVFDNIINHTGMIQARSVSMVNGEVILEGGDEGVVNISGVIDVSGREDGETGGAVQITGDKIGLFEEAQIDASGDAGGGEVLIGGGYQGKDPDIQNASRVYLSEEARIIVDALQNGDGGTIILWSNDGTQVYGYLSVRGGSESGNGGFIETSSLNGLEITRSPDIAAPHGYGGTWLVDPYNIEIVAGGGNTNINGGTPFVSSNNSAQLGVDLIVATLANGDVIISTGAGGAQAGNIVWTADMDFNAIGTNKTLTLNAHNDITLNGEISQSGAADDSLNLIFNADSDSNGAGAIIVNNVIETGGGFVTFQDGVYLRANVNTSTDQAGRAGGNITFANAVLIANAAGITLTTTGQAGDGNVSFQSTLDSGNTYAYDGTALTWNAAEAAASGGDGDAAGDTYLATVTSALENSIVTSTAAQNQAWLGGSDAAVEGDWRWVTGPEGLENGGDGRPFWSGLGSGSGGSAVNGAYSNWNGAGEPNDAGGEDALQLGAGTQGQWNDLPNNSSTLGSIIETNLAPTDLTITAGTGTVTFTGVTGANKALGDLTISSAGNVSVNNAMTVSEDVAITNSGTFTTAAAGDMTITSSFTHSGTGSASLAGDITTTNSNIQFNRNVSLAGNVALSTGAGAGDITFVGTLNGANSLELTAGSGNVAFNTGIGETTPLSGLTVHSAAATSFNNAESTVNGNVAVTSTNINLNRELNTTSGGTATFTNAGTLFIGPSGNLGLDGAFNQNGAGPVNLQGDITTTNDNVSFNGAVSLNDDAAINTGAGAGDITFISTLNGANDLNLTAGTGNVAFNTGIGETTPLASLTVNSASATSFNNAESFVNGNVAVTSTNINLNRELTTTGGGTATFTNSGTLFIGPNGNLDLDGAFNQNGAGPVNLQGDIVTTNDDITFNGAVTLNDDSTLNTGAGGGNILFSSTVDGNNDLAVTAGTGSFSFTGAVGSDTALASWTVNSAGDVNVNNVVNLNGNAAITNSGTFTTAAAGDIDAGGSFTHSGTGTASLAGDITASSITFNRPIAINTDVTFFADGANGNLTLSNSITKSAGADAILTMRANNAVTINSEADITSFSNALDIILNSDRDANQAGNILIDTGSFLTSNGGDIVLSGGGGTTDDLKTTGFAYGTSAGGANNRGIYVNGARLIAGAGDITLRGTGASINATVNQGVDVVTNSIVQTTSGDITMVGVAGNGGVQNNQQGVVIYNNASVTTVSGDISLTGTANNGTGTTQIGVNVTDSSVVRATGNGTIAITGTGGAAGAGTDNYGVLIHSNSVIEGAGSGAISINATAGANSAALSSTGANNTLGEGAAVGDYSGTITVTADSMNLANVEVETTGDVTLQNATAGRLIDLGSAVDTTANTLELSDAELDNITATNLTVGRATAGDVTVSAAISPANVDRLLVTTGGAINGATDDDTADVTANKLSLTAASGGIGTTTPLDVAIASAFSADTSADSGNILVDSIGDLPVELIDAGSGTVTLRSTGRIDDHAVDSLTDIIAGTLNISADGGISTVRELELQIASGATFPGSFTVNVPFTGGALETGEDILDDDDQGADDFTPAEDVILTAGGVIGTLENPIEVDVPGTLFISAGKARNGVSVVINGNFESIQFLNVPPGLVIINGHILGGAPINDLRTSFSNLFDTLLPQGSSTDTFSSSGTIDFPGLGRYADWMYSSAEGWIDDSSLQFTPDPEHYLRQ